MTVKMSNAYMATLFLNSQACTSLNLDPYAKEILRKIAYYMDKSIENVCYAKQVTLAKALNMDRKTVSRKTCELAKLGILTTKKRGKLNSYRFGIVVKLYINSRIAALSEKKTKLGPKLRDMGPSGTRIYSNEEKKYTYNPMQNKCAKKVYEEAITITSLPPSDLVMKYMQERGLKW